MAFPRENGELPSLFKPRDGTGTESLLPYSTGKKQVRRPGCIQVEGKQTLVLQDGEAHTYSIMRTSLVITFTDLLS